MADISPAPVGLPEPAAPLGPTELEEFGVERRSQWRMVLGRFLRHRLAVASLIVLTVLTIVSFLGSRITGYEYDELTPDTSEAPSAEHWFGTDSIGHDLFTQVLRGASRSLLVALSVAILATVGGTLVGAVAGYYRGLTDSALMRLTDLFLTIPTLAVLLVVSARFRDTAGWATIAMIIAGFAWMSLARVVRGLFLSLREREFVEAARALGASDRRIIIRHMVPNSLGPIIVNATLLIGTAIIVETALSFLGFGIQPPDTSLGLLVEQGVNSSSTRPWLFYLPGLWLIMIVLSINFIGDGLRDAFDPQQSRVRA
jgi:ABC-type dipeptide/oligopeptide/nickel transport system permease subunit